MYDTPTPPTQRRSGMPGWAWALIGCFLGVPLLMIPILAVILFPVFAQAREKARQANCLSNVRIQSLALRMYAQDFGETLPPAKGKWMDLTRPYMARPAEGEDKNKQWRCPSLKGEGFGYALNTGIAGKTLPKLTDPASEIVIFDSSKTELNALAGFETVAGRHSGFASVGYADGHTSARPVGRN